MIVPFALTEIPDDALKLSESDLVSRPNPLVELRRHAGARVSERADPRVQRGLAGPARVVSSASERVAIRKGSTEASDAPADGREQSRVHRHDEDGDSESEFGNQSEVSGSRV